MCDRDILQIDRWPSFCSWETARCCRLYVLPPFVIVGLAPYPLISVVSMLRRSHAAMHSYRIWPCYAVSVALQHFFPSSHTTRRSSGQLKCIAKIMCCMCKHETSWFDLYFFCYKTMFVRVAHLLFHDKMGHQWPSLRLVNGCFIGLQRRDNISQ